MDSMVHIFKALSDETRLKILIILSKRKICAKGLAKYLKISESAVSQHIRVLKEAGIIVGEKKGYYVHYHIQKSVLLDAKKFIEEINDDNSKINLSLGIDIPECKASCKTDKKEGVCQNFNRKMMK